MRAKTRSKKTVVGRRHLNRLWGDPDVGREIYRLRPSGTEVVVGKTARFISEFAGNSGQAEPLQNQYQLTLHELEARAEGEFIIGNNLKMKEISKNRQDSGGTSGLELSRSACCNFSIASRRHSGR